MFSSEIFIYIFLNLNNPNKTFFGDLTIQLQFSFLKIRIYFPLERSFIERNATGDNYSRHCQFLREKHSTSLQNICTKSILVYAKMVATISGKYNFTGDNGINTLYCLSETT